MFVVPTPRRRCTDPQSWLAFMNNALQSPLHHTAITDRQARPDERIRAQCLPKEKPLQKQLFQLDVVPRSRNNINACGAEPPRMVLHKQVETAHQLLRPGLP